jgi:hypothetical protein
LGAASAIGFTGLGPTYVEVVSITKGKAPPLPIVAQNK